MSIVPFFLFFLFLPSCVFFFFFFFNDTATTEIYTLSLHDALPICLNPVRTQDHPRARGALLEKENRSEEHTSELQSHSDLVCRLLLEKKKNMQNISRSDSSIKPDEATATKKRVKLS